MAISHRSTGAASFAINSFAPVLGAGAAVGDMMLLLVGGKPYNSGISVSGWTALNFYATGTTAAGTDSGSPFVTAWWKEHDGSETDPTITEGSPAWNVVGGLTMIFQKGGGEVWETPLMRGKSTGNTDTTGHGDPVESNPGITTGDFVVSWIAYPSDAVVPCSSHVVATQTSVTFTNTHDPATDPETTTGGDFGMCFNRASVSGTGTAIPTITATTAITCPDSAGLIRLRVSAAPAGGDVVAPYMGGGFYP